MQPRQQYSSFSGASATEEGKDLEPNNLIFVFFWDEIDIFNPKNERVYIHHREQRITTT